MSSSRERMLHSAAALIAERGYAGTSLSDVVEASGGPRGSIYYHFPRGKSQIASEALTAAAGEALAYLQRSPATTPSGVMAWFVEPWRARAVSTGGSVGCVLAGTALALCLGEEATEDDLTLAESVRTQFRQWHVELAGQFERCGVEPGRAESLARVAVAAMEGALILCRVEGDVAPLEATATELMQMVERL